MDAERPVLRYHAEHGNENKPLLKLFTSKSKLHSDTNIQKKQIPISSNINQNIDLQFENSNILIVDDVLTTGKSMIERRQQLIDHKIKKELIKGVVLFSRGKCPKWVTPIFTLNKKWQ